jgi:hypothetical protein
MALQSQCGISVLKLSVMCNYGRQARQLNTNSIKLNMELAQLYKSKGKSRVKDYGSSLLLLLEESERKWPQSSEVLHKFGAYYLVG